MKKSLYLIAGILIGITLFGGSSVLAAGITAERSTNRIYVNGQEVHLTAYNINGNNYVMLRDVGKTVFLPIPEHPTALPCRTALHQTLAVNPGKCPFKSTK